MSRERLRGSLRKGTDRAASAGAMLQSVRSVTVPEMRPPVASS